MSAAWMPEQFWRNVCVGAPDACWPWLGRTSGKGYGMLTSKTTGERYAHRVAWLFWNGRDVPSGMLICHHCDNRPCCNPAHLFVGTFKDNTTDMFAKGRGNTSRGEHHYKHKLTAAQVLMIRQKPYTATARQFADRFHVSKRCIDAVRHWKNWRHLSRHELKKAA